MSAPTTGAQAEPRGLGHALGRIGIGGLGYFTVRPRHTRGHLEGAAVSAEGVEHIGSHIGVDLPSGRGGIPTAAQHQLVEVLVAVSLEVVEFLTLVSCLQAEVSLGQAILRMELGHQARVGRGARAITGHVRVGRRGISDDVAADLRVDGPPTTLSSSLWAEAPKLASARSTVGKRADGRILPVLIPLSPRARRSRVFGLPPQTPWAAC